MKLIQLAILTSVAALGACSKSDSKSDGPGNGPGGDNFKNTTSPEQFRTKASDGRAIFADMGKVKQGFKKSGTKMFGGLTMILDDRCTDWPDQTDELGNTVKSQTCVLPDDDGAGEQQCLYSKTFTPAGQLVKDEKYCTSIGGDGDDDGDHDDHDHDGDGIPDHEPGDHDDDDVLPPITDDQGDSQLGGLTQDFSSFLPSFDAITDCEDAFKSFDSLYDNAKTEYDGMLKLLENPAQLKTPGVNLTQAAADDAHALVYEFKPEQQVEGMTVTGRLAGGASEDAVRITTAMAMDIDLAKLMGSLNQGPQGPTQPNAPADPSVSMGLASAGRIVSAMQQSVTADLKSRLATFDLDGSFKMVSEGQPEQGAVIKGQIVVSAGTEKFVTQKLSFAQAGAQSQTITTDLTAKLVDERTITMTGTVQGAGLDGDAGTWSYVITRPENGTCQVKEAK